MKKLTLELIGYRITGLADLTLWGGEQSSIQMKPFTVKHLREIRDKINDNGFGVESINGAICEIDRDYGKCTEYSGRTIDIGKIHKSTYEYWRSQDY